MLTVARGVGDEAGAVAVVDAAVVVQELAGVASGAVLAMLAGAVLADLAMSDGGVVLVRTLAAVVDRRVDDEPGRLANEGVGAAALELADARGGKLHRAGLDAGPNKQVPPVAADPAGVAGGSTVAPVAVHVRAPTARASLGAGLDLAALARDGRVAPAGLEHPVGVARGAATVSAAGAATPVRLPAVSRARADDIGRRQI